MGTDPANLVGERFSGLLTIGGRVYYEMHFAHLLRMQGSFNEVALDIACEDAHKPGDTSGIDAESPTSTVRRTEKLTAAILYTLRKTIRKMERCFAF
jgi:hypothetical protein